MAVATAFIILMRAGESTLSAMAAPFMVDLGIKGLITAGSPEELDYPFPLLGHGSGFLISKFSLRKVIWPFLLAQNFTNLVYMALALSLAKHLALNAGADVITFVGHFNPFLVACAHAFDQFADGLGTAVLITFLMRTCTERFKAAHFAIGTGLLNVSGFLAQRLGYGIYFGLTFLLSIPGMCLILFVLFLDADTVEKRNESF